MPGSVDRGVHKIPDTYLDDTADWDEPVTRCRCRAVESNDWQRGSKWEKCMFRHVQAFCGHATNRKMRISRYPGAWLALTCVGGHCRERARQARLSVA